MLFAAGAWSLLDACRMCASSKLLRSAWMQLLRTQPSPHWLLAAAAEAAQAQTPQLQERAVAMVTWLLLKLPEAGLAQHPSVPAGLLAIPRMPLRLAQVLSSSGVRMPYAAIGAAARARVEGEAALLISWTWPAALLAVLLYWALAGTLAGMLAGTAVVESASTFWQLQLV